MRLYAALDRWLLAGCQRESSCCGSGECGAFDTDDSTNLASLDFADFFNFGECGFGEIRNSMGAFVTPMIATAIVEWGEVFVAGIWNMFGPQVAHAPTITRVCGKWIAKTLGLSDD